MDDVVGVEMLDYEGDLGKDVADYSFVHFGVCDIVFEVSVCFVTVI